MRLAGKVAIVTGGGSGIVLAMAREGADVAIPDIPDAIGSAAVSLASDEARYITGQARNVDGGCLA